MVRLEAGLAEFQQETGFLQTEPGCNDIVSLEQKGSIGKRRTSVDDLASPWSPMSSTKRERFSSDSKNSLKQLLASEWNQYSTASRFESIAFDCTERPSAVGGADIHGSCLPEGGPLGTSPVPEDFTVQLEEMGTPRTFGSEAQCSDVGQDGVEVSDTERGGEKICSSWDFSQTDAMGAISREVDVNHATTMLDYVAADTVDRTRLVTAEIRGWEQQHTFSQGASTISDGPSDNADVEERQVVSSKGEDWQLVRSGRPELAERNVAYQAPSFSNSTSGIMSYQILKEEHLLNLAPDLVIAINAGGGELSSRTFGVDFVEDRYFNGGDVFRTEEGICQTQEPSLYQTARYGNVSYVIPNLTRGEYIVNLHFAEIIFTSGPPGMRVFDISIQGRKVVSELDVYSLAGSNKALVLSVQTTVSTGALSIFFEGVCGSPTISAICLLRPPASDLNDQHGEVCSSRTYSAPEEISGVLTHCVTELRQPDVSRLQTIEDEVRRQQMRSKARQCVKDYELKLEELKKECHAAWISLEESQTENERLRNDLTSKTFYIDTLANVVETQQDELKELKEKCETDVTRWRKSLQNVFQEAQVLRERHAALSKEAKEWTASFPDIGSLSGSVQELVKENQVLKAKFLEESQERRQLYNKVLELKGNIRVFCRCRPLSLAERAVGSSAIVDFEKDNELALRTGPGGKKVFKFDRVFSPQDGQEDVFADTAPVVVSVLDGYNVCIFAYGQTGTGKTFTMLGSPDNRGVNYRTLEELFRVASDRSGQFRYEISVSVLEVYNEQIRDLLTSPSLPGQGAKKLEIKQVSDGVHHVPGLIEAEVYSMSEVWEVLQSGSNARAVGSTNSNEHSSRSHFMLCVMVKGENLLTCECTRSKLWLVDLAGSERVTKSDVQGERLKEAQNINKSLASLGDVIYALTTKSSHIPYRNSKLTHLLQDSLGGDSKALMFVQISPNEADAGETVCSLNFASRVRGIELGPAKKQLDAGEMLKYKQQAEKAKQDLKKLEDGIRAAETKLKMKEQLCQALTEKVRDRDKTITELELQVTSERRARLAEASLSAQSSLDRSIPDSRTGQKDGGSVETAGTAEPSGPRRPLLERALGYDLRQPDSMENVLKCSTDSSGFRNENMDPEQRISDKLKLMALRVASPTPQKLMPRRTGRASFAGVPRRSSMLPSSFVVKTGAHAAYDDLPLPLPTTVELSNEPASPVHRAPGTASRVVRPSLRRSTMQFTGPILDPSTRKVTEKLEDMRKRRDDQNSHRSSSLSSAADRKKAAPTLRVSLTRPLRTVAGSGAQRVLSGARPSRVGLKPAGAAQRERVWNKSRSIVSQTEFCVLSHCA